MKASLVVALASWSAACTGAMDTSGSLMEDIIARGYLRVGTTGSYAPFSHLVSNATRNGTSFIGADIDMATSLASAMGLTSTLSSPAVVFIPTTFADLAIGTAAGDFDIGMSGVSITLPRALQGVFFSTPVLRVGKVACARCERVAKGEFATLASIDQPGVKVATPAGGSNEAFDRTNFPAADIVVYADNTDIFRALLNSTADVVVTDRVEAELWAQLHRGVLCAVRPESPYSFEEIGYVIPRDVAWLQFVNAWLHIQQGSGEWNSTLQRWMDHHWES
ncbi:uncharacterized protein PG998_003709 [Apiospora kogelbergensis]|uniref:Solute-binding protein family 3/N-terminal domain-containing protein n=1 Tax=Apiospora kogelbergensis TaxID=1337665 RepID=A0AAW0QK06_9PEZI